MNIELNLSLPDGPIRHPYLEFRDNEDFLEMGFAGPFGTAKTTSMVDAALLTGINYPGAEILIARGHASDLRATTLVELERRGGILFSSAGGSKNQNLGEYRFPPAPDPVNPGRTVRSVIRAIGLDRADLQDVMKSRQPFRVFLEEGNEMPPDAHNLSLLRARQMVFHRELKNRHRVAKLAKKWGLPLEQVQAYLGYFDADLERPMQGLVGVKTIWNPEGNDHLWKRYCGVPYPEDGVTVEWAKKHIGIREEHIKPEEHQDPNRRYEFLPDDLVLYEGKRRVVGCTRNKQAVLIPSSEGAPEVTVEPKQLTLIAQRALLYAWPWMNKSGNKDNHKASFLIPDKEMAAKYFGGRIDVKSGLVLPQFDPTPGKGHVVPAPGNEMLRNHRAIGAVDHGGGHATAAVIFVITWDDRLVAVREYVQAGLSATQNAYNIKAMVPPELDVDWYCDPSMQRKAYETDAMSSAIDAYAEAGLMLQPAPAKGDEAVDVVKNMLVFKQDMIRGRKQAEVYVSDGCPLLIQAWSEITWKDLTMRRDKWIVDVADAAKYALSAKYANRTGKAEVGVVRAGPQVARFPTPHAAQRPPFRARV